jgi:hypothetical protein
MLETVVIIKSLIVVTLAGSPFSDQAEVDRPDSFSNTVITTSEKSTTESDAEVPRWVTELVGQTETATSTESIQQAFVVMSNPEEDLSTCQKDIQERIEAEIIDHINNKVLRYLTAEDLQINKKWIEKNVLSESNDTYTKVSDLPSGRYYQIYRRINLSPKVVRLIQSREQEKMMHRRSTEVGALGGIGLAGMGLLSGLIGLLAKREKAKQQA